MPRLTNSARGFTLIESIMASAVLLAIIASTALMLSSSRRSYLSTDTALSVQDQASLAFDNMHKELAAAFSDTIATKPSLCSNCAIDFELPLGTLQNGIPERGAVDSNGVSHNQWRVEYRLEALPGGMRQLIRIVQDNNGIDAPGEVKRIIANNVDPGVTDIFQIQPLQKTVKIALQVTAAVAASTASDTRTTNLLSTRVQLRN